MKTAKKTSNKWAYWCLVLLVVLLAGVTLLRNIPMKWAIPQVSRPGEVRQIYVELNRDSTAAADGLTITDPGEVAWICDQLAGQKLIYSGPYGGGIPYGSSYGDLLTIRIGDKSVSFRADGALYTGASRFTIVKGSQDLFQTLVNRFFV